MFFYKKKDEVKIKRGEGYVKVYLKRGFEEVIFFQYGVNVVVKLVFWS